MRSSLSGSPVSLVFRRQEWLMGDDLVQVKYDYKDVDPLQKQPNYYTYNTTTHLAS